MNDTKVTPAQIIILASGAVMVLCLFLPWFGSSGDDFNAFGDVVFPFGVIACLAGIAAGVVVALTAFANANLPEKVWQFTWNQVHFILGFLAATITLGFFLIDSGGTDKKIGLYLALLASAGVIVGAVMLRNDSPTSAGPSSPPTSF